MAGTAVGFSARATVPGGVITGYQWTFGDGRTANQGGAQVSTVFPGAGIYPVTMTATSSLGAVVTRTWDVDVTSASSAVTSIPSDAVRVLDHPGRPGPRPARGGRRAGRREHGRGAGLAAAGHPRPGQCGQRADRAGLPGPGRLRRHDPARLLPLRHRDARGNLPRPLGLDHADAGRPARPGQRAGRDDAGRCGVRPGRFLLRRGGPAQPDGRAGHELGDEHAVIRPGHLGHGVAGAGRHERRGRSLLPRRAADAHGRRQQRSRLGGTSISSRYGVAAGTPLSAITTGPDQASVFFVDQQGR